MLSTHIRVAIVILLVSFLAAALQAADAPSAPCFHVVELTFHGESCTPRDTPARDVELAVTFRHESGEPVQRVQGFWDGNGKGGASGDVFKVRFCPTREGAWKIVKVESNSSKLHGQREGETVRCTASKHPGLWIADGRWYRRSDGSHPLILGNTHYTFLSRQNDRGPVSSDPVEDIAANARYFKKLRFSLGGGRYVDPQRKPFFDAKGRPSDDGRHAHRPNPQWFAERVDPVVARGYDEDLICDLILCGPDTREQRSTLDGDPAAWLRYVAARYGSYPHVWFCLCNEWNIKNPRYAAAEIVAAGRTLRRNLPHASPVSVHGNSGPWDEALDGDWCDHAIVQRKLKRLDQAADFAAQTYRRVGRKPVVNDENAYQGKGDGFSRDDVIEGCLGTFLGGGYPTTGEKYASKLGQYFWGGFDAAQHTAAPHLGYLRDYVDRRVAFWRMAPLEREKTIFAKTAASFRVLGEQGAEYLLGSNAAQEAVRVKLPEGKWRVTQVDVVAMGTRELAAAAEGEFTFSTPASRAALTHFVRNH